MNGPVDHIARSILPWRPEESTLTECGLPAASYPTITRAAYFARSRDLGRTRTAMLTCVTCDQTTQRWRTWEEDPVDAMQRETAKYNHYAPERAASFRRELLAISALIANHREEFDAYITPPEGVVSLDEARRAATKKPRHERSDKW